MGESADIPNLLHASSVYLDHNLSNSMPASENVVNADAKPNQPLITQLIKPRRKARNERAERVAAEEAIWVRQKFDLPDTEQLIASFSAALVKSILLQGRIYITSTTICFYTRIFGRTTKETYPFSQLSHVKKRRGGFVANAIKIYFSGNDVLPVVIGSLNHRERAFSIIQERLRELNPDAAGSREGDDVSAVSVGNSNGGESEDRSFDGDEYHPDENANTPFSGDRHQDGSARQSRPPPLQRGRDLNLRVPHSDSSEFSSQRSSDMEPFLQQRQPHNGVVRDRHSVDGPPLVWMTMHDVLDRVYGRAFEKKTERARGVLHAPVKEVFNLLFVSDWLKHYHDSSSNREVTFTDWFRGNDGFMEREVNFKKPLGYKIGPKETRVKETQRYSFTEVGGVIVELEGQNLDAPYGDYFVCESFFELIPQTETKTLLIASIAVHFHKSTVLRGKIESGALAETKIAFQRLYDMASKHIEDHIARVKAQRSGAQKRQTTALPNDMPASPTKKFRSLDDTQFPSGNVISPTPNITPPVAEVNSKIREAIEPQTSTLTTKPSAIQPLESASSRTLRIAAISALLTVCILLVAVLLLLNKMRNDVSALEKIISTLRTRPVLDDAAECVASRCGADGTG